MTTRAGITTTVIAVTVAALVGCAPSIDGSPRAAAPVFAAQPGGDLGSLLLPADEFPAAYPATVLDPAATASASADLDGVARGAVVDPLRCTAPRQAYGAANAAMAVGTDAATRSSVSVQVLRSGESLDALRSRVGECGEYTVSTFGARADVRTEERAVPGAAELGLSRATAYGYAREITADVGDEREVVVYVAQTGAIRVVASVLVFGDGEADTAALATTFADAVRFASAR
ncbi:hypothetical protein [Rhodococcus rhodnii]|uniref:DUF5642 domain-containing protein n=1 Tax=Rhodococcus rhodnii LMG 5362 TaxID=1273125 RepID=R7WSA0_9NOCA|nr:hypothetical protein [Rhodococcus rhodnii]EOM78227.1 hypothetical protein Rrhod_0418 [Rhodococcus rhodnii LMG 5362]